MNNTTTALCPGMQCRTVYDNFLDECASVSGVGSVMDEVQQALDAISQTGRKLIANCVKKNY